MSSSFTQYELKPYYAPILGIAGASLAMALSTVGSAYGTCKSMSGISLLGRRKPALIMRSIVPVVMAGILAINGLAVSVIIIGKLKPSYEYSFFDGVKAFSAGLTVGLCNWCSGYAIGELGNDGSRAMAYKPVVFTAFVAMQGFAMVIGLYGLIVAVIFATQ
uniref:V-type proton ATPase proteolipid subunit n=1 Tax=Romanomermis culicivorax TaxID=13658 RepID=A0A915JT40_ROMCU